MFKPRSDFCPAKGTATGEQNADWVPSCLCHSSARLTLGRSPRLRSHIYKTRLILSVAWSVVKVNWDPLCPYRNACHLADAGGCAGPMGMEGLCFYTSDFITFYFGHLRVYTEE